MILVSIYKQTCLGAVQFRVMRDDGQPIFDRLCTDFPSEDEAAAAVLGEFRRKRMGSGKIRFYDCLEGCKRLEREVQINAA